MKREKETKNEAFCGVPLFAAANSGKGFISFYDDIFGRAEIERRYIIKGGPGTGKSGFLRRVAEDAEGRGLSVEYYRCSSDPDSLDGIVVDGRIALLDGTAPHSMDTELPGARDEIVNLGEFWDAQALGRRRREIALLSEEKSACYRRAYRFLGACDDLYFVNRDLVLPTVKHEKLSRAVSRLLRELPDGDGFSLLPGLVDSVGMKGRVRFDSYEQVAGKCYVIEDHYETGALFLRALITGGMHKECAMRVSYHPIHVGEPDAVYFCDADVCFVLGETETSTEKGIAMKRFVDAAALRDVRSKLRVNRRLYDSLLESACDALTEAGAHHFALEQIYVSCMDFEAQNRFARSFCQKIV